MFLQQFTNEDYGGFFNLKKAERNLMHRALVRTHGNVVLAHQLLCPNNYPYNSADYLHKILKRHGINYRHYKT